MNNNKSRYFIKAHLSQQHGLHNLQQNSIHFQTVNTDDNYVDALDPENLMQCPYDKNHQIRACRFPYHLVKCRKNHPDIVQKLVMCPFNARHHVPREEISQHIAHCDDKRSIEQDIANEQNNYKREVNVIRSWQSPPCEEDWDKDLEDSPASAFIWGTSRSVNRSGSSTTVGYKNHLASCLRAPKSLPNILPWKNGDKISLPLQRLLTNSTRIAKVFPVLCFFISISCHRMYMDLTHTLPNIMKKKS